MVESLQVVDQQRSLTDMSPTICVGCGNHLVQASGLINLVLILAEVSQVLVVPVVFVYYL